MSASITLVITAALLVSGGVYLLLERSLIRVLLGVVLLGNAVSVMYLVVSGPARGAPLVGERESDQMSDPLPQAMVLTAIVIAMATVSYVLALAYREWYLTGTDDVPDDMEDRLIRDLAEQDETSLTYDHGTAPMTEAEEEPDELEVDPDDPTDEDLLTGPLGRQDA